MIFVNRQKYLQVTSARGLFARRRMGKSDLLALPNVTISAPRTSLRPAYRSKQQLLARVDHGASFRGLGIPSLGNLLAYRRLKKTANRLYPQSADER